MHPNVHSSTIYNSKDTWKQPKCPSTDNWITKIYTLEYYSAAKKEWYIAICSNMDGPRDYILSEVSHRERQILYDTTYMWNLKNNTNESIYKRETD